MASSGMKDFVATGFEALGKNDLSGARNLFEQAISQAETVEAWYGLSRVLCLQGAFDREGIALDRALALGSSSLQILIAKGDWHAREKDMRKAGMFYSSAVNVAETIPSLPPFWRAEVERVQRKLKTASDAYYTHLVAALKDHGFGKPGTQRFSQALDLLMGRTKRYYPQPTSFYFPGLPQSQFYEREMFPWAQELEGKTGAIRAELQAVLADGRGIVPYTAPNPRGAGAEDPRWSVFNLILDGRENRENALCCPATMEALRKLPLCWIDGCSPSIMFSLLLPGARIVPHHGLTNVRLICHLPLIVPLNCGGLRVGSETRPWKEGQLLAFDDTIEHDAWNSGAELRAVLLFDVWRPELSQEERVLVSAMLTTVSCAMGQAVSNG